MPRKKTTTDPEPPPFEEAIGELEAIVAALEEEHLPLEELVEKYEKGTQLLTRCESVLSSAKKRLKTIAATNAASAAGKDTPESNSGSLPDTSSDEDDSDDDDIRLF